jgi:hypothetical protein
MRRVSSDGWKRIAIALTVSTAAMGASAASYAQGVPPPPEAAPPPPAAYPPPAAMPPGPAVVATPPAEMPPSDSDFDVNQRRWAIGYAGVSQVPTGLVAPGVANPDLTVPALGLRYWLNPGMGLDLALGIGWNGGSSDIAGMSTDKSSVFGILVQGGLPFVLSAHKHVNFELMPYLTLGYGRTSTGTGATEVDMNGFRLDVGARAGFEVFFGFIGIPELALSATVGLQFEYLREAASAGGTDATDTTLSITTTVQNNPWDIFTGNISARYYF